MVQSTHEKYVSGGMRIDMTLWWHGPSLHLPNMTHKSNDSTFSDNGRGEVQAWEQNMRKRDFAEGYVF